MRIEWMMPTWGWPLLVLAAAAMLLWTRRQYAAAAPPLPAAWRRGLTALRGAALLLLLLAAAGPTLHRVRAQARPPEAVIVLDDSASMGIADAPGGQTRWQRALKLAAAADSTLRAVTPATLVTRLRGNGLTPSAEWTAREPGAPPEAVGTDLTGLAAEALQRWAGRPLRALVIISDGHDTGGRSAAAAPAVGPTGAAVLAVGVGDPIGPPDLLIQELRYPDLVYQGDEVVVEAVVANRGPAGGPDARAGLRLRDRQGLLAQTDGLEVPAGGIVTAELVLPPRAVGLQVCELELTAHDNESFLANNRATLAFDVRQERSRVLLLAGRPGWDSRFLALAAAAEPRLRASVVRPGPDGPMLADSTIVWSPPRDAAAWGRWDCVVLAGWEGWRDEIDWQALAAAVRAGLGLLVVASGAPAGSPAVGAPPAGPPPPLLGVLPVALGTAGWATGEWSVAVAPEAGAHPILAGVTHGVGPGRGLDSGRFPPLRRVLPARALAGATTLLLGRTVQQGGGAEVPILVAGRGDQGRVVWFGGQRLWELALWEPRLAESEAAAHPGRRLLRNLLVWTAADGAETGLALVGQRKVYQAGERIRVEALWRDLRGEPVTGRPSSLELRRLPDEDGQRQAEAVRSFPLEPVAGEPGRAAAVLPALPPGRYAIRPVALGQPREEGGEETLVVVPHSLEASQTRQDRRQLRALAAAFGGDYLAGESDDGATRLARALADLPLAGDRALTHRRWTIWAGWPLLGAVVLLLGLEWGLRRWRGLL